MASKPIKPGDIFKLGTVTVIAMDRPMVVKSGARIARFKSGGRTLASFKTVWMEIGPGDTDYDTLEDAMAEDDLHGYDDDDEYSEYWDPSILWAVPIDQWVGYEGPLAGTRAESKVGEYGL